MSNTVNGVTHPDRVVKGVIAETIFKKYYPNVKAVDDTDDHRYLFDFWSTIDNKTFEVKCFDERAFGGKDLKYISYSHLQQLNMYMTDRTLYDGLKPRFVFFTMSGKDPFTATFSCKAIVPFCEMVIEQSQHRHGYFSYIPPNRLFDKT